LRYIQSAESAKPGLADIAASNGDFTLRELEVSPAQVALKSSEAERTRMPFIRAAWDG
jgi:SOS-response transcriptional repressor LexA